MFEDELTSQIIDKEAYKTEIARKYTKFLAKYPEILTNLVENKSLLLEVITLILKEEDLDLYI